MKRRRRTSRSFRRAVAAAVVVFLLFATGFHIVAHHDHPHFAFGEGVQATLHGEDRKLWLLPVLALVSVFGAMLAALALVWPPYASRLGSVLAVHDPVHRALRRGIINPKICG